jgi:hypothetical protein
VARMDGGGLTSTPGVPQSGAPRRKNGFKIRLNIIAGRRDRRKSLAKRRYLSQNDALDGICWRSQWRALILEPT